MDFEYLRSTFGGDLWRSAKNLCGNAHDADELVQEVWRKVISTGQRPEPGKERSWLVRILRNSWFDRWRQNKNNPLRNDTDLSAADPQAPSTLERVAISSEDAGLRKLELRERVNALQDCLQRIQEEYRLLLIRTFYLGQTYTRVSSDLAIPVGTIASRVNRGKSMIRDCMEAKGL